MIIFDEKQHYKDLTAKGFEKYINRRDLTILAKQWAKLGNLSPNQLVLKMQEFCNKWVANFNAIKYENMFIEIANNIVERKIKDIDYGEITFFSAEISNILELHTENEQKLLFMLMCLCKMRSSNYIYLNSGTPLKLSEICKMANIKLSARKQDYLLSLLYKSKFITISIKPLLKCEISIMEECGDKAMQFLPNSKMIEEFTKRFCKKIKIQKIKKI